MGFHHFVCCVALAVSLLGSSSAFAAEDDVQKCKSADHYHNAAKDYQTCNDALEQHGLSKEVRAELLLGRGEAAYFAGRFELSSADLDEALALNPSLNQVYLRRAWTRVMTNQYAGALQDITALLAQEPDNADAHFALGFIYLETPEWESRTMPAFKRALEIDPNHFLTRLNLAKIYSRYKGEYRAAVEEYDRILGASEVELSKVRMWRDPSCPCYDFQGQVRYDRAELLYELQDYSKALADYDVLVSGYPNVAAAFIGRGHVYGQLRKFNEALADAQTALKLDSRWPAQRLLEIESLYQLKRHDEALLRATKLIVETNDGFARGEALFWRGFINKALHHNEESLEDFEQSFSFHPQWLAATLTQLRQSGYYAGEVTDYYNEKARNGLQACILDPECASR
jgi:tetratricopeptide (TPR) repeat protein